MGMVTGNAPQHNVDSSAQKGMIFPTGKDRALHVATQLPATSSLIDQPN